MGSTLDYNSGGDAVVYGAIAGDGGGGGGDGGGGGGDGG